jgi:hypothetical protein
MDRLYLPAKVVANISMVMVMGLEEAVVAVLQEVVVVDP